VETTATTPCWPTCAVQAVGNGRRRVTVPDLQIAGTPTAIMWAKRTSRCREAR
jgi:hypothetical protein